MSTTQEAPQLIRGYHLLSTEHAISTVALRRLKVARFSEVNDPFELFALNCMKRERRAALKGFKASQDAKVGLLCFSEAWKNPVLWSHYADGHRGICLGFDVAAKDVQKVRYEDNKLQLGDEPEPGIPRDAQNLLFVTKFRHWQYEQEFRVVVELSQTIKEGNLHFYPFGDDLRLREVILGHLCPESLLTPMRLLVRTLNLGVVVSKARLGFKYFEVKGDARYPLQ